MVGEAAGARPRRVARNEDVGDLIDIRADEVLRASGDETCRLLPVRDITSCWWCWWRPRRRPMGGAVAARADVDDVLDALEDDRLSSCFCMPSMLCDCVRRIWLRASGDM